MSGRPEQDLRAKAQEFTSLPAAQLCILASAWIQPRSIEELSQEVSILSQDPSTFRDLNVPAIVEECVSSGLLEAHRKGSSKGRQRAGYSTTRLGMFVISANVKQMDQVLEFIDKVLPTE